jgi:hypothetical protein
VFQAPEIGLYRMVQGDLTAVMALGPAAPREFEETIASPDKLAPAVEATGGGILRLSDGAPDIRAVAGGRVANGRGWIGITPREAWLTQDLRVSSLLPGWAWLMLVSLLAVAAWLREGRVGKAI